MEWLSPARWSPAERRWLIVAYLAAVVGTTLPYVVFAGLTPPEKAYAWASVFYFDDYFQYYAWARRIAAGDWLIRNYYDPSPDAAYALFNPYFLILGWLTRACGNVYGAYHLARALAIGGYLWVAYAFAALNLARPAQRRWALGLALGGGLEYPFAQLFRSRYPTPLADPYVFKVLYRYGHLTLALGLLLLIFGCHLSRWGAAGDRRAAGDSAPGASAGNGKASQAVIFGGTLLLGLINPYYLALVVSVLTIHVLWRELIRRDARGWGGCLAAWAGAAAPAVQYAIQNFSGHLGHIAFDEPIGLQDLALFFAPLLALAALGWRLRRRPGVSEVGLEFIILWAVLVGLWAFSPLAFRARMTIGLAGGLAIPAALWFAEARGRWAARGLALVVLGLEIPYTFYKEGHDVLHKGVGQLDRSLLAALEWLDGAARPGDLVLAIDEIGNFVPAYTPARTYVGHSFQTADYEARRQQVRDFFHGWSPAQRRAFLRRVRVRFVLVDPSAAWGPAELALPGWELGYERSGYCILQAASPP